MRKYLMLVFFFLAACRKKSKAPVVGFVDAFEDNTVEQAKNGFVDTLAKNGFDELDTTVKIIYLNTRGNIPALTQILNYYISQNVSLIAANASRSAITAVQKTKKSLFS